MARVGVDGQVAPPNYALSGPLLNTATCPELTSADWKGNSGGSWVESTWAATLYNHAIPPNATASCISEEGVTALLSASSAHAGGVNVLYLDGSVRTTRPTIAREVWKSLATTHSPGPAAAASSAA